MIISSTLRSRQRVLCSAGSFTMLLQSTEKVTVKGKEVSIISPKMVNCAPFIEKTVFLPSVKEEVV